MNYVRIAEGLNKYRLIPATENVYNYVKNNTTDYYRSIFFYNDSHYKQWKETGTIAGIKDTVTNSLFFDFDSVKDIKLAQADAVTLVSRLVSHGIPVDDIQIAYSGQKGFSVEIDSATTFTPDEFKTTTLALAGDLSTFDKVVSDPNRIVRLTGTKHPKSGLYKIPLTANQLSELPIEVIKDMATSLDNIDDTQFSYNIVELPTTITKFKIPPKKSETITDVSDLDLSAKPKWISDVRYALQEGFFPTGEGVRNKAFLILAATYKKQGFNKELVYRMLKGVAEVQATRNESDRYPDKELWNNVVQVVFSPQWKGGIYKDSEDPFLLETAKRLGIKIKTDEVTDYTPSHIHSIHDKFKNYVSNIDKNTIKTGIQSLDEKVFISVGANVGIVGAPGSGKSSLALNILNNTSKMGMKTVFASFDMARTRMYEKILYKVSGLGRDALYKIFKEDPEKEKELYQKVKEEFGNVYFFDKSAASVQDIKNYIEECNELAQSPEDKIKLVLIDYFEMISSDVGDDTASSKKVAQELQGIVNTMDVAQIVLLQPNKMSGDMREPIKSYTNIKGSSFLAQSFRIALGIFREGYDPQTPDNDKYLTINVLKNDLGETGSLNYNWNGKRGEISEMDQFDEEELIALRKRIALEKSPDNEGL